MLIHADGLSLYGTGATGLTNMAQGVWAELAGNIDLQNVNPRGNGTHHLRVDSGLDYCRRALGADYGDGLGFGCAYYLSALPSGANSLILFQARDSLNAAQYTVMLATTGTIDVRRGDHLGTIVASSASPAFVSGSYQHMELFAVCGNSGSSPTGGSIEIRVNGVTVLNAVGIDNQTAATNNVEQYVIGTSITGTPGATIDFTDIHTWDTTGTVNNDFLGDVQWLAYFPTADETATDWVRNVGSTDFSAINEVPPNADTSYIEASAVGNISEFQITNVPANTSDIVAIISQPMLRKTDAGTGSAQMTLLSSNIGSPPLPAKSDGADRALSTAYTYYVDKHEVDPATGVRWTPSAANAARLRLTRTA